MYLGATYPNNIVNMDTAQMFTLVIRLSEKELKKNLISWVNIRTAG